MAKIFVSYRRQETGGYAGWLSERLKWEFGVDDVFIDIGKVSPGEDFEEAINKGLSDAHVLIAVIGRKWLEASDPGRGRRLDDPRDYVRWEIASALGRKIRVIPVLIEGATMPREKELPIDLASLARLNAIELSESHFHAGVNQLVDFLRGLFQFEEEAIAAPSRPTEPAPKTPFTLRAAPKTLHGALAIETTNGESTVIVAKGAKLPAEASQRLTTFEDDQRAITMHVVFGDNERAADNVSVKRFDLDDIRPAPMGVPEIEVTFHVDDRGVLSIQAEDEDTGRTWHPDPVDLASVEPPPLVEARGAHDRSGFGDFQGRSFQEFFQELFPEGLGGEGSRETVRHRGEDLEHDLELSLEEAVLGHKARVRMQAVVSCSECGGSGARPGSAPTACDTCGGTGGITVQQGFFSVRKTCSRCDGTGKLATEHCSKCAGEGRVSRERTLLVKVPPGADSGTRLRLAGQGEAGKRGGPSGDLYVNVTVREHPFFTRRDGSELHIRLPVSSDFASRGGRVRVPMLGSTSFYRLSVPPRALHGARFSLKKKGVKDPVSGRAGHLTVVLDVYDPRAIPPSLRERRDAISEYMGGEAIQIG